jgi:hypothetical protein
LAHRLHPPPPPPPSSYPFYTDIIFWGGLGACLVQIHMPFFLANPPFGTKPPSLHVSPYPHRSGPSQYPIVLFVLMKFLLSSHCLHKKAILTEEDVKGGRGEAPGRPRTGIWNTHPLDYLGLPHHQFSLVDPVSRHKLNCPACLPTPQVLSRQAGSLLTVAWRTWNDLEGRRRLVWAWCKATKGDRLDN